MSELGLLAHATLNAYMTSTEPKTSMSSTRGLPRDFQYCVAALPIEGRYQVLQESPGLMNSDPMFRRIGALRRSLDWMVGLQFYLSKDVPVTPGGIMLQDSPWALTATSQVQFWKNKRFDWRGAPSGNPIRQPDWLAPRRRRAPVRGVISVIISNWDDRGDFQDLTAKACTPKELGYEVWSELKADLNERPKNNVRLH